MGMDGQQVGPVFVQDHGHGCGGQTFTTRCGELTVREACTPQDLRAVARLRAVRFRGNRAASDLDRFDPLCTHLLVLAGEQEAVVGAARCRLLSGPEDVRNCYSGQYYDLTALGRTQMRLLEIGRICIAEGHEGNPDIPRALLAGLTRASEVTRAQVLVGCASFQGADPAPHTAALRYLHARYLGPRALRPGQGRSVAYDLCRAPGTPQREDLRDVPALLRLYLAMGGWVSDHAVCDHDLDTLHVFTAVEISAIPTARRRALRMLARGRRGSPTPAGSPWALLFDTASLCEEANARERGPQISGTGHMSPISETSSRRLAEIAQLDPVWGRIRTEAQEALEHEPLLGGVFHSSILHHRTLEQALAFRLSQKLASAELSEQILREIMDEAHADDPSLGEAARADIVATFERDPACTRFMKPLLYFKGFQAVQAYRIAHWLYANRRFDFASLIQMRVSECFGVDIHPGARIGKGIMIDHAHSIVIGETAVVGDNVSMLHSVTLGGTGKEDGDRHPKIGDGVLIGAGAKVLGNISVGDCARIAAGSVVLEDVPARKTVAGVPARIVGEAGCAQPSLTMDQLFRGKI